MRTMPVDEILLGDDGLSLALFEGLDIWHGKVEHGRVIQSLCPLRRAIIGVSSSIWSDVVGLYDDVSIIH
jgi:hypothetical protein